MTENALVLAGIDTTGLTAEELKQLTEFYQHEMEVSREGVDLQPIRFKISKDTCTFTDPFGNAHQTLDGVIIFKQKVRGYWDRASEDNVPECSSQDGKTGITKDGSRRSCATCPLNEWGSGEDEAGNKTKGKACKEMRRLFIVLDGYQLPILVSLPPTSLRNLDSYVSARLTQGIPDIAAKTVISLSPEKGGRFSYAVANFKMGERLSPKRMLELNNMRAGIQAAAERMGIEEDDYLNGETVDGQTSPAGDDEPF